MSKSGKELESFVRQIEKTLLPTSFTVKGNERIFNDDGIQIAEFDIEIRGRLGSTDIAWLIECRDRPGQGPAPGSWIEQLVGRRQRFGFNTVTAVSTTGFADGAVQFATASNIELRTVRELTVDDIVDWFRIEHMTLLVRGGSLDHATLVIAPEQPDEVKNAFEMAVHGKRLNEPFLISTETGKQVRAVDAFSVAISKTDQFYNGVEPGGPPKPIRLLAKYTNDASHFVVTTSRGNVRITEIYFIGTLSVKAERIPIERIREYSRNENGENLAQIVSFKFNVGESKIMLDFQKIADTGQTQVIVRQLSE